MRRVLMAPVACLTAALAACAPMVVPVPVVTTPRYSEFVEPLPPPALAGSPAVGDADRAWRFLQAGDLQNAERELALVLKAAPSFYPADASAGYVALARKDPASALPHFDRALERQADYVSALVGKGHALLALDREGDALAAFEAATRADPSLADVRRRVEVLRFRAVEQRIGAARGAAAAGRLDEAVRAYGSAIASTPDSAFLYRELAAVERRRGDDDQALVQYRRALEIDRTDVTSLTQIADILQAKGDLPGAVSTLDEALAIEATPAVEARRDALRARIELAKLPDEYRAIENAAEVSRGDLAALLAVRLQATLQAMPAHEAVVLTDVRTHWAEPWIMTVARAGVIEPFANHTFQPRAVVRRTDLADAVTRVLASMARPDQLTAWQEARASFLDLPTGHLAYPAASLAVASGVLPADAGAFQPSRAVTGAEATRAVARLEAIAASGQPGRFK